MIWSGTAYQLPPSAPLTAGIASGLLDTPTTEGMGSNEALRARGLTARQRLMEWPTPMATDGDLEHGPRGELIAQIRGWKGAALPTPTDASKGGGSSRSGDRIGETPSLQGMARKGLWPTPNTPSGGSRSLNKNISPTGRKPNGKKAQVDLAHTVRMVERELWPTPTAGDGQRAGNFGRGEGNPTLPEMAKWPTPRAIYGEHPGMKDPRHLTGAVQAAMFPSPAARDWRSGKGRGPNGHTPQLPEVAGGLLNPRWVEWLMGWPIGWTSLEPLEMDKFQLWLRLHGGI